ncbi:uncharacterized protein LOC116258953 [Nymphaea colorata]|nr:uncharacterized protein LOC116258953 [Nymphaea colorata]XP_031492356.1 uncharacterized protein LOC116258953 [Nymphaea colorata]
MAAATHPQSEPDSVGYADSVGSSPRSTTLSRGSEAEYHQRWAEDGQARVRFMCSFGGRILPRPHDNQLRYVGGETRIVAVGRNTGFAGLMAKLSKIAGDDVTVKYQLPNEDLDALISVTTDEDVENMIEEFDRLSISGGRAARLRLFLFPASSTSRSDGLGAFLDGSKRGDWFLDALNGGGSSRGGPVPELERRRSEASSVVSEVPDYLFGFDHPEAMDRDDGVQRPPAAPKSKLRPIAGDQASASESGSPAPPATPQHISTPTSAMSVPPIPDLPPLKIKPEGDPLTAPRASRAEPPNPAAEGFPNLSFSRQEQVWPYLPESHYPAGNPPVAPMPVYYIPAGAVPFSYGQPMVPTSVIPPANLPLPTVLLHRASQGQVYRSVAPETRPAAETFDYPTGMIQEGAVPQPVYYAPRMYPVGTPAASDGQLGGNAADMIGRISQTQQK